MLKPGLKYVHGYDSKFKTIQASSGLLIASPRCSASAQGFAVCRFYHEIFNRRLNSYFEELAFAGIRVSSYASHFSFSFVFSGYGENMHKALEKILEEV